MKLKILSLLLSVFLLSCSSETTGDSSSSNGTASSTPVAEAKFTPGTLHPHVFCKAAPESHFALYLPTQYTPDQKWPVLYAFDSHARGNLPVKKYQSLADRHGWILVGSHNSKNGLQWPTLQTLITQLTRDVEQRFSIDSSRVYMMGFSGGARVASQWGFQKKGVHGIIGCGAGFMTNSVPAGRDFHYIAMVGNQDFNYLELKKLEQNLKNSPVTKAHYFHVFDGIHEWPPVADLGQSMEFMNMRAMADGLIPREDSVISKFQMDLEEELANSSGMEQMELLQRAMAKLEGLADLGPWKAKVEKLASDSQVMSMMREGQVTDGQELIQRKDLQKALLAQDLNWWKGEAARLHAPPQKGEHVYSHLMRHRLLSYLSLITFFQVDGAMKKKDVPNSERFLELYTLVDPSNAEHRYRYAILSLQKNDPAKAMEYLQEAAEIGFDDANRMEQDADIMPLRNMEGYTEVLAKVKANAEG